MDNNWHLTAGGDLWDEIVSRKFYCRSRESVLNLTLEERNKFVFVTRPLRLFRWHYPSQLWKAETHVDRKFRLKEAHNVVYSFNVASGEETYDGLHRHQSATFIEEMNEVMDAETLDYAEYHFSSSDEEEDGCRDNGVVAEVASPYTPHYNNVEEEVF